jgi:Putative Actinobacterial Holin-X, holin superfamily III
MSTSSDGSVGRRDEPLGEVARDLTRDLSLLVRQEVELAKAEMAQKGRTAAPGFGMIGGAAATALFAGGALTAAVILLLAIFLPEWLAALIVGAMLAAAAYLLAQRGKERVAEAGAPIPEQTIETVKEDVEWAKTRASSARN